MLILLLMLLLATILIGILAYLLGYNYMRLRAFKSYEQFCKKVEDVYERKLNDKEYTETSFHADIGKALIEAINSL